MLLEAFRRGATPQEVHARTSIDLWFLRELQSLALDPDEPFRGDRVYRSVDTCAAEFAASTPYFYSGLGAQPRRHEVRRGDRPSVVILGSGPNRIGQGIEFDYCCVHAAMTVRASGRDAVMVNCNPETVSTDYDTSDRLYFEPLTLEDVLAIVEVERPEGVIVQFGGQTPLKLAAGLQDAGVPVLGTSVDAIDLAEDRGRFGDLLDRLGLRAPRWATAHSVDEAIEASERSASRCSCARATCSAAGRWRSSTPPTACTTTWLAPATAGPGRSSWTASWRTRSRSTSTRCATASASGSAGSCSTSRRPACTPATAPASCRRTRSGRDMLDEIRRATEGLALALGVVGLVNVQYAVADGPRCTSSRPTRAPRGPSRSSPRRSGVPLAKMACRLMLGERLDDLDLPGRPDARAGTSR